MAKFTCVIAVLLAFTLGTLVTTSELGCTKKGLMAHPDDCKKFVVCLSNGSGDYYADVHMCDRGEAFDAASLTCVPIDQVKSCNTSTYDVDLFKTDVTISSTYNCDGFATSCYNCRVLAVCQSTPTGYVFLDSFYCKDNLNHLYCDSTKRACTNIWPTSCSTELKCSSAGTFPVAYSCSMYQTCTAVVASPPTSVVTSCPAGQAYVPSSGCVAKTGYNCYTINCPSSTVAYVTYPGDNRYYALCISGIPEYVFNCPYLKSFNPAINACDVYCTTTVNIPDVTNCNYYYKCGATVGFTAVRTACPAGTKFDVVLGSCQATPIAAVPTCGP